MIYRSWCWKGKRGRNGKEIIYRRRGDREKERVEEDEEKERERRKGEE